MIDPNASFHTDATDTAGFFQDLTRFTLNQYALKGVAPTSVGVATPTGAPSVTDAASYVEMIGGWMAGQPTLDPNDAPVQDTYRQRRYDFLSSEEGVRNFAYDDKTGQQVSPGEAVKGHVTVGVGFNMDDTTSQARFAAALPGVDFGAVHDGRQQLTDAQVQKLFDANVRESEAFVGKQLQGMNIPEHQRLALVSLAFSNPSAVNGVISALKGGNQASAIASILTVPGSTGRRVREAAMFAGPADAPNGVAAGQLAAKSATAVDSAFKLLGLNEQADRDTIRQYLRTGGSDLDPATTPWCAAFVNAALATSGIKGSGSNVATSFENWGRPVDPSDIGRGDVILLPRGLPAGQTGGHVGFATGAIRQNAGQYEVEMLSGNLHNSVSRSWEPISDVMIRRAT